MMSLLALTALVGVSLSASISGTIAVRDGMGCSADHIDGIWEGETLNRAHHYDIFSEPYPTLSDGQIEFRCEESRKPGSNKPFESCGFSKGWCNVTAAGELGKLVCRFNSTGVNNTNTILVNATIEGYCSVLIWNGNFSGPWQKSFHHPSCPQFINETVCHPGVNYSGCSGGCGVPDNCIDCTLQYSIPGKGYYPANYYCTGGLEEIRQICNATRGRKPTPVVNIEGGKVQGFIDPDSAHAVFRGIPYAKPPQGDLRWRPPQPVSNWQGVFNASEFGNTCAQNGPAWSSIGGVRNSSEDCLYLNVYAPTKYLPGVGKSMSIRPPTLIYFPAGQYLWGSGNDAENFIAPQTPAGHEVIVVTANYRLGAAGFMALEELRSRDTEGSIGNYGTLDQRAAMKWIKDNIQAFGGDPNNVVLWGESAGAAAVTGHLAMPKSWPYFHKAIMESSTFNGWSYKHAQHAVANSERLAHNLNCTYNANDTTPTINVTCLLEMDIKELVKFDDDGAGEAAYDIYGLPYADKIDRSLWSAVIDGVNLMDTPANTLAAGQAAKVPILFGTNRDEGSTFTYNQTGVGYSAGLDFDSMYNNFLYDVEQSSLYERELPIELQNFSTGLFVNESEFTAWAGNFFGFNVTNDLQKMYRPVNASGNDDQLAPVFNPEGISSWWWAMSRAIGDYALSCPARAAARLLDQQNVPAYVFLFNHTPTMSINQKDTEFFGAFHGSEVPFVYYDTFELVTEGERKLSEAMVQYWAGFAWNSDPNVPPPYMIGGLNGLPEFPRYSQLEDRFIVFGDNDQGGYPNITTVQNLKKTECDWWDSYVQDHCHGSTSC